MTIRHTFLALAALFLLWTVACTDAPRTSESDSFAVRIRLEAAAPVLNPYLPSQGYSRFVAAQIFQTLGILDPESLVLKPLLLTEIPALRRVDSGAHSGRFAYDFVIHPDAVWDDGSPVTAQDVAFTLKIIFHPLLPTQVWRGYFEQVKAFEADPADPKKFTIYFEPYYMLALESMCQVPIYPAYHYDPEGHLSQTPLADLLDPAKAEALGKTSAGLIAFANAFQEPRFSNEPSGISGSNAYRLGGFTGDNGMFLLKKDNWWGDNATAGNPMLRAFPDTLIYRIVKDDATLENMLRNNELDVAVAINPVRFLDMQKDTSLAGRYAFSTRWSAMYTRWIFNMRHPILADKKVRQALAHVVDYDYLLNTVLQGLAARTVGPVNPEKAFYNRNITPYDYNLDRARALLAEAGWSDSNGDGIVDKTVNGKNIALSLQLLNSGTTAISEQTVAMLVKSARQAGMELRPETVEFNKLTADTRGGKFETAVLTAALHPGLVELYQQYHSKSLTGDNRSGIANTELDQVIDAIRSTDDEAQRNKLYLRAQEMLHDELPEVYLYAPKQRYIVSRRFDYVLSTNRPGYYEALFKLKP